jgi:hypothetical protein
MDITHHGTNLSAREVFAAFASPVSLTTDNVLQRSIPEGSVGFVKGHDRRTLRDLDIGVGEENEFADRLVTLNVDVPRIRE